MKPPKPSAFKPPTFTAPVAGKLSPPRFETPAERTRRMRAEAKDAARPLVERLKDNLAEATAALDAAEPVGMTAVNVALQNETEVGFWTALVFQTTDQKDAFLKAVGIEEVDNSINGEALAARLGIPIPARPTKWKTAKVSARLADLARQT